MDEVCTVELIGSIQVTGNSASFNFQGVGSNIVSYVCKLDGVQLDNCTIFIISLACMKSDFIVVFLHYLVSPPQLRQSVANSPHMTKSH